MKKNKFLIIGNGRHGKDTLAEIWSKVFDFTFTSSSLAAAEIFIYDALKDKYGYKDFEECYADRINRRAEWYELIKDYNSKDRTRLAKKILENNDCYVGMRERQEIIACKEQGVIDLTIWVDACERLPEEDKSSFNIEKELADVVIENNLSIDNFTMKAIRLGNSLHQNKHNPVVGLDIDGVLAEFSDHFLNWFDFEDKSAPTDWDDRRFRENFHKIAHSEEFWSSLPPIIHPKDLDVKPSVYITARDIPTEVSKNWILRNGFPDAPVITVGMGKSKVEVAQACKLDVFYDDSYRNFCELNEAGIKTYLVTRSHNMKYTVNDRVNKYLT